MQISLIDVSWENGLRNKKIPIRMGIALFKNVKILLGSIRI